MISSILRITPLTGLKSPFDDSTIICVTVREGWKRIKKWQSVLKFFNFINQSSIRFWLMKSIDWSILIIPRIIPFPIRVADEWVASIVLKSLFVLVMCPNSQFHVICRISKPSRLIRERAIYKKFFFDIHIKSSIIKSIQTKQKFSAIFEKKLDSFPLSTELLTMVTSKKPMFYHQIHLLLNLSFQQ